MPDRDGTRAVIACLLRRVPTIRGLFPDGGCQGSKSLETLKELDILKRSEIGEEFNGSREYNVSYAMGY